MDKGNAAGRLTTGGERAPGGPTKSVPAWIILADADREVYEWACDHYGDAPYTWHAYQAYYRRQFVKAFKQTTLEGT